MLKDEAIQLLRAAQLMMKGPDGSPISDLHDAVGEAIDVMEAPELHLDEIIHDFFKVLIADVCKTCLNRDCEGCTYNQRRCDGMVAFKDQNIVDFYIRRYKALKEAENEIAD